MNETPADASDAVAHLQEVPFDSGCLGILFVLMVLVAAVFAITAFDSDFLANLSDSESRRNIFAAIAPLRVGGINFGAAVLSGMMTWEAVRLARRFLGRKAVWIDGEVIRFHPTVRRRAVALRALEAITHESGEIKSILRLTHTGGKRITIHAVEHDAAVAFVAEAERAKAALTFD